MTLIRHAASRYRLTRCLTLYLVLALAGCATTSDTAPAAPAEAAPPPVAEAVEGPQGVLDEDVLLEAGDGEDGEAAEADLQAAPAPEDGLAALLASMDPTADPCQDFYRYACGGWLDSTERPSDQARWVRSFSVINERNQQVVRELLEDAAADPAGSPARRRIGEYYAACMDEAAVEATGTAPLDPWQRRIAGVDDPESLMRVTGELFRIGVEPLFGIATFADFAQPDTNIAFTFQGGLGMPERDYYVSDDERKRELMAKYEAHVARMLDLLGEEDTAAKAAKIVAFETALARMSRPATEMRQMEKLYNRMEVSGLQELTPALPWDAFFTAAGHPEVRAMSVATPEFFEGLEPLVAETSWEDLRTYLRWHLVHETANLLPADFVTAHYEFFGRELSGQPEIQPRWKRCVSATEGALGEDVGKLYVAERFAGDSKEIATEMISDIQTAFADALPELTWMDEATRRVALEKAEAVRNKIGYPDEWRDYSDVETAPAAHFVNSLSAREHEFDFEMAKIGEPVDKGEWGMTPQQVNAYYNPLYNEIVFPAGILQPPFFDRTFPAAMSYGAIGAVIGHELTHGFDDSGRKFDPQGRLRDWWDGAAVERFEERAQCVRDLYSGYEVEEGVFVNGELTAGENIADIGGLKQAHAAYELWEKRHGEARLDTELTSEQVLFVAFGQVWCSLVSEEFERMQVTVDSHSPGRFRVIGPVSQNPDFADAFACQEGDPMSPADRCQVW